ncbi:MAG: PAS domain S-box protein [Planctomycetales bacterium]|nr:PAS domain S-box protein [Planctomycetales bacterium]MBN8625751.1 PAS domain S-box protein [Planctomycetota bacterium]
MRADVVPPPLSKPDDVDRPWLTGPAAHAAAVASCILLVAFRWAAFDYLGTDGSVAWSMLLVVVAGRILDVPAMWTLLFAGAVPIVWLRWLDVPHLWFWTTDLVLRLATYFALGSYLTLQRGGWRTRSAEMKRNELAAVAANSRWELASEFAQIGTFELDLVEDRAIWSPVMQQLHGFAPGEHDGKPGTGFQRILPEDLERVQADIARATASGEKSSTVYRVRLPDGSIRWIEAIGRVQFEHGRPRRIAGVCFDVTDRHEAQLASLSFKTLTDHAPIAIYQSDAAGNCLYVNPAFEKMIGGTLAELQNGGWPRFIHPDDREHLIRVWSEAVANPSAYEIEVRYVRPDGHVVYALGYNAPLLDVQGRFLGFVGCVADLTARRQAEASIESTEARMRALVTHADAAVFLKDLQGRYQTVNAEFERIMQMKAADILGRTDEELFPAEVARAFRETDLRVLESGKSERREEFVPLPDGEKFYLSVKYPITDSQGRVVALGGFATDITERKAMEDALRRDRKLLRDLIDVQEQERQFICNELHDGTIQFLVGALMHMQSPSFTAGNKEAFAQVEGYLVRATSEARRLIAGVRSSLLDDMGVVAAIDDLVAQNQDMGLAVRVYRDHDFRDLDEKVAVTVFRVVQEALSNVRKHAGVQEAEVELRRGENEIIFIVRDDGRGFTPGDEQPECFGLRGMRERVLLAGGQFSLTSARDKGTTVRCELPLTPPRSTDGT